MNFFTIIPSQKSGFTDQLLQLAILLTIGRSLNFCFYHTKLSSARSSGIFDIDCSDPENKQSSINQEKLQSSDDLFDIYDFIGINDYLHSISSPPSEYPETVKDVSLSDELMRSSHLFSLDELLRYILSLTAGESGLLDRDILFRFSVEGQRTFYKYVVQDKRFHEFSLNLRGIYDQTRTKWPHQSLFSTANRRKVLVHVRQGDISVIKTPWGTYIPVDKRIEGWLNEFHELKDIKCLRDVNQLLFPNDFFRFLSSFPESLNRERYEMLFFSDGYDRAFRMIFDHIQRFGFSESQKQELINSSKYYNDDAFRDFHAIADCKVFIGESVRQLFDLVDSVLNADIIVVGVQQRMIVKLVSLFCPDSGPVVIVLFRSEMPDFSNLHPGDKERFLYIDIDHYNTDDVRERIAHSARVFSQKSREILS